jgi:hypothetical protein
MKQRTSISDVRAAINTEIRSKQKFFTEYQAKNRKAINLRKRLFNATKRARSFPFTAGGYFDPETQTVEINNIIFGAKRRPSK